MDDSSRILFIEFGFAQGTTGLRLGKLWDARNEMNRRAFLKLALASSAGAIAGYYGPEFLSVANASVQSLSTLPQADTTASMSGDWKIPHLLRRAGFGASPDELSSYENLGVTAAISNLLNYENTDDSNLPAQPDITMALTKKPSQGEISNLVGWWVDRMIQTSRPLEERMALFWHNHFATAIYKVRSPYLMFKQNELLRNNAMGDFGDLLMGITKDPAMLIWLDGARSRKVAPNENYGREVMEVFTMGVGNYTEDDVKAAARAFTGYGINKSGDSYFNPNQHDDGTKTFLGQTGNFGPEGIVNILSSHPATAKAISTKLFEYFAYDNPSNDIVDQLANVYTTSNGNIKAVVEAILNSDAFWSDQAHLGLVKSPIDYLTTAVRSLGATITHKAAVGTLNNMGQLPFNPPSVFGWPSGVAWINTSTIIDRYNFPLLLQGTDGVASALQDGSSVDAVSRVLYPEGLPSDVLQVIQNSTNSYANSMDQTRNLIRLTMSTPYYNLN
jgi:hypothetical protein